MCTSCTHTNKDVICFGDLNLCLKKWNDAGFPYPTLANVVKDFLISEDCSTLVEDYTRIRQTNGSIQRSSLDQIITNCPSKMNKPEILAIGKIDHLGLFATNLSREIRTCPRTIKKIIYKNFNKDAFINDIMKAIRDGAFNKIHEVDNLDEAIDHFSHVYSSILEEHAPTKIIQNRNNYVPYITEEIRLLMKKRNTLKVLASKSGNANDLTNIIISLVN